MTTTPKTSMVVFLSFYFILLMTAGPARAGGDPTLPEISAGQRHYFRDALSSGFPLVKKGMAESDVKVLVGGSEYPAHETSDKGFAFALDEKRSGVFTFADWIPPANKHLDFFVAPDALLVIFFDDAGKVTSAVPYPRNKENVEYVNPRRMKSAKNSYR